LKIEQLIINAKKSVNLEMNGKEILVSILIRTKNEDKYIGDTLSAIMSQSWGNFEILIVDSGSTDKTLEIARQYPVKVFEIRPEDFTWGYALNFGFERARGKYVICLSAHALPKSDKWLETLISNLEDDTVAAVMSNNLPCPDCNPFDRRGLLKKFSIPKQEISGGPPYIFGNYGSVIRRSIWEEIPFDETLRYAEDHDWALKVTKKGYKIIYEPDAILYHSHNETLRQIFRRSYMEANARKALGFQKYSIVSILFDVVAGSIYDMWYVFYKRDHIKWFFFAPLRRVAINCARYRASRIHEH
jgi:glycosyltransferase involved in cell wall biosynthesis